ncbi:hypothetical protein SELMODRAFT_424416 [Selaginella moellendorffii]|uniref:Endonuclease/exonuclease/phosphatase domain-containing protein n=1 Tax=Selaginella moellendorffii TaxID=88036 RepID=D8SPT9_SELML|nr:hypothetical protein SELMODRAFT_424416 [Selaginella moellendorffii]
MKLLIKLKQCPLPPPKDNEAAEPEPEANAAQATPPRPTTTAKTTREPTRAAPSSSADTVKITKKKKLTAMGGKKSKRAPKALSSRQTIIPPLNTTLLVMMSTFERIPSVSALKGIGKTSKEKAIPAVPLEKMKESNVLYLGWTRVDELDINVEKDVSPHSAAALAMLDVTAPVPGELHVEANEVLMELQERQAKAAKNLILAIFKGNKPHRQAALEGLKEGLEEARVSFWGRPVTFLGRNYYSVEATREESGDQLIHVLYTGKAPIPNKIRIMGKVHSAQGGTSRRQSNRASKCREEAPRDGQASPEMTRDQWGGEHTIQRSPSLERARVERSPSEDPVPRGQASSSQRFMRLKVNLWLHVSSTHPRKYLALWSGPLVGYVTPTFHMARDQLPKNGVHSFLEASEEYRMQEHQTIFKFSKGKHFWNLAVGRRGGTLIITKGPWQSLGTSHQILILGRTHMIVIKHRLPTGIDDWILVGDFNFVDHEEDKWGGIIQDRRTRAEHLAWNSFLLQIGTCDAYEIPGFVTHEPCFTWRERQRRGIQRRLDRFYLTMDLCMQGGKLDIDNTYTDFSDHHLIRLTLPFRRSRGPKKPVAIPKKFFEEQANNNQAHEQWKKHKGNLHSFTLQIAQEARAKIQKDVFNTVQKVRRVLTSINTNLRSNPDDPWLQAQKIQVKHHWKG